MLIDLVFNVTKQFYFVVQNVCLRELVYFLKFVYAL